MPRSFRSSRKNLLEWYDDLGYGKCAATDFRYGAEYFDKYRALDQTPMAEQLTQARIDLVRRHCDLPVIDVGIGGGLFVARSGSRGYDVCPDAVAFLRTIGRFADPYDGAEAVTMWDSLEHIADPAALLAQVRQWLFVSMPIYRDRDHCLASKHFKPGEHIWYFTNAGFVRWVSRLGFDLREINTDETRLGREDVFSYAFRRDHG